MWGSLGPCDHQPMARTVLIVDDHAPFRAVARLYLPGRLTPQESFMRPKELVWRLYDGMALAVARWCGWHRRSSGSPRALNGHWVNGSSRLCPGTGADGGGRGFNSGRPGRIETGRDRHAGI